MSNPDSYYDPPEEGTRRCECGCDWDDHAKDSEEVITENPTDIESNVREALRLLRQGGNVIVAIHELEQALNICGGCGNCMKFEPAEDGDDAEFDSARDAELERK